MLAGLMSGYLCPLIMTYMLTFNYLDSTTKYLVLHTVAMMDTGFTQQWRGAYLLRPWPWEVLPHQWVLHHRPQIMSKFLDLFKPLTALILVTLDSAQANQPVQAESLSTATT